MYTQIRREENRSSNGELRRPAHACEAAEVGGLEEVDDGAEQLVGEHRQAAQRRVPPAVPRRFHRRRPGRIGGLGRFTRPGSGWVRAGSESIVRSVGIARLGWDGRGGPEKFVYTPWGAFSNSVDAYWIR